MNKVTIWTPIRGMLKCISHEGSDGYVLKQDYEDSRNAALEDAAEALETNYHLTGPQAADIIRAMKEDT